MLAICGDVHGEFKTFNRIVDNAIRAADPTAVIQVGDFGIYGDTLPRLASCKFEVPVYFIDGNHEDHDYLERFTDVTEIHENCFYVPRGTILTLDGKLMAFMGGGASVDKAIRLRNGWDWSEKENITDDQYQKLWGVEGIDVFITHAPPQSVTRLCTNPRDLVEFFGLPMSWIDPNAVKIQQLWERMGCPVLYAGHLHKSFTMDTAHVLDINECVYLP